MYAANREERLHGPSVTNRAFSSGKRPLDAALAISSSNLTIEDPHATVDDAFVIFVLILLLGATSAYVSWAFSSLRKARNEIRSAWNNVEATNGQRAEEVTQVLTRLSEVIAPVHLDALRRAHERVATAVGPRSADQADRMLRAALDGAWLNAPRSNDAKELQVRCEAATRQIDEAARAYNNRVADYERLRTSDARRMLAGVLGFERESYFATESSNLTGDTNTEPTQRSSMHISIPGMPSIHPSADPSLGLLPPDRVAFARPVVNVLDMMAQPPETNEAIEETVEEFVSAAPQYNNPLTAFAPRSTMLGSNNSTDATDSPD